MREDLQMTITECLDYLYKEKCLNELDYKLMLQTQNSSIAMNQINIIIKSTTISTKFTIFNDEGKKTLVEITKLDKRKKEILAKGFPTLAWDNLPEVLNISQNHQTHSLKDVIAGGKDHRIQKKAKINFDYDVWALSIKFSSKDNVYNTTIKLENFIDIKKFLKPNMAKLLDLIFFNYNRFNSSSSCHTTIAEYMDYLGRKNTLDARKEARKEVKEYLNVLQTIKMEGRGNRYEIAWLRPFSKVVLRPKGQIEINLDRDIERSLENSYFKMHKEVGQLKNTAYFMASWIYRYVRFKKSCDFKLTNETLYEYSGLPRYEDIKEKGEITRKIIDPYHKAVAEIQEVLKDKIIIEQEPFEEADWESFKFATVSIKIMGYEFRQHIRGLIESKTAAIKKVARKKRDKDKHKDKDAIEKKDL